MAHNEKAGPKSGTVDLLALLDRLSSRLSQTTTVNGVLDIVLEATLALHGTPLATVHLLDAKSGRLHLAREAGFESRALDHIRNVASGDETVCGRAMQEGRPIAVSDVDKDPHHPALRTAAAAAGYRAAQSTPLVTSAGVLTGMLSTYFRESRLPADSDMLLTRLYARVAADKISGMKRS